MHFFTRSGQVRQMRLTKLIQLKKYHNVPGVTEGNLRLRLACGLLTPSLRQFPISDSNSVNFGLMFKQYREESSIRSGLLSLYAMA